VNAINRDLDFQHPETILIWNGKSNKQCRFVNNVIELESIKQIDEDIIGICQLIDNRWEM
jgi:hypothetical protein